MSETISLPHYTLYCGPFHWKFGSDLCTYERRGQTRRHTILRSTWAPYLITRAHLAIPGILGRQRKLFKLNGTWRQLSACLWTLQQSSIITGGVHAAILNNVCNNKLVHERPDNSITIKLQELSSFPSELFTSHHPQKIQLASLLLKYAPKKFLTAFCITHHFYRGGYRSRHSQFYLLTNMPWT